MSLTLVVVLAVAAGMGLLVLLAVGLVLLLAARPGRGRDIPGAVAGPDREPRTDRPSPAERPSGEVNGP